MNSTLKNENKNSPNPILKANLFSKLFFIWTRHIFKKGLKDSLNPDEVYENHPYLESQKLTSYFQEHWNAELRRKNPNLLRAIFFTFIRKIFWLCLIFGLFEISLHASQPLLLGGFLSYFSPGQTNLTKTEAYCYATGIVVSNFLLSVCFNYFSFRIFLTGLSARYACGGLIYRKCLEFSISANHSGSSANAISILCNYFSNIEVAFFQFYNLWKGPLEVLVFAYVMWYQIGWQSTIGIGVMLAFIPVQIWAGTGLAHYRRESGKWGDKRVQLMNEIIAAIQVIKMYAWEKCFAKLIAALRKCELKSIRGTMQINAGLQCSVMISRLALFASMMTYIYTDKALTPSRIFIATSYYGALNESMLRNWSQAITLWAELIVCLNHANTFLQKPTNSRQKSGGFDNLGLESDEPLKEKEKGVFLRHISGTWDEVTPTQKPFLHIKDITCQIVDGQFFGIAGNVGAGKTTLLQAILGELELTSGSVEVNGSISYAAQDAWIFRGTIRENILFIEKYNEERYKQVLHVCELERDLELMPHGDTTIVGERGLNLSGGQRARLNLARAIYRQADIYLFDDPLSAMDSCVGKRLMEKCLLKFLSGKTRILVTHHVQYLQHVNHVLFIESGALKEQGSYEQLNKLMKTCMNTEKQVELLDENDVQEKENIENDMKTLPTEDLMCYKEHQVRGSVKLATYINYFKALRKPFLVFGVLSLFVVVQICQSSIDVFTAKWATLEDTAPQLNQTKTDDQRYYNAAVYAILICCIMIFFLLRTLGFFLMCLKISLRLHDMLFNSVIRASMLFFNINPSGRIINRFSNDLWRVDVSIPQAILDTFLFFVDLAATLLIVGMANYWLLFPAAVILILLYTSQKFYMKSSRSLKRIESITCSPVYSHINQTVEGLATIRALKASQELELEFHRHHNTHISSVFMTLAVNRAFGCLVDIICSLYILLVTFSFLILGDHFSSGDVGLAITQSLMLLSKCQFGIRRTANMENYMTSVERVMEYINEPVEYEKPTPTTIEPQIKEIVKLDSKWPDAGRICFEDVQMRYRQTDSPILKGLNFTVQPKEKIGIVGRTGAGKSSIIQAIFRLARNEGSIEIDGRNINNLALHELRSRISIIPQDPVLFTGTLRFNLDPYEQKSDEEMWRVLDDVELKSYVLSLEGGLDCNVCNSGANFSTGQRQLVCLARAILRQNKILIMDEATANVDPHTDKLIQMKIRTNFNDSTVLTIAHRLHTVMDSDRVLVMDAGQIVEMDHPKSLLQNKNSHFYKLVNKATNYNTK